VSGNTSSWLAKSRRLASNAYHRTVGEVIQRRRSRAYMAAGGPVARPDPITGRDLAMTRALERPQDRTRVPQHVRTARSGRTPR
jgi:hypothetical protein